MVCRDAYTRASNYWAGSPDFKGGNKLQLSVDYLSAYPLLPLHYPCSLLFYYKGICTRCVEVCDTYLIVLLPLDFAFWVCYIKTDFTKAINQREIVPPVVIFL